MTFTMKPISVRSITTSIILISILTACGLTVGTRSMIEALPVVTIPGAVLPVELSTSLGLALASPEIDLGSGENFVTFVRIRNVQLQILDSSDQDSNEDGAQDSFDFLSALEVSIRAEFDGVVNEILIARLPDGDPQFGAAARTLDLSIVSNADIFDFLLAPGGYDIVLNISGTVPPDAIVLSGLVRYRVGLGLR